jgi:hypothetical protein
MGGDRRAVARVAFSMTMTKTCGGLAVGVSLCAGEAVADGDGDGGDVVGVGVAAAVGETHDAASTLMTASARARTLNMVAFDRVAQLATRVNADVLARTV